MKEKSKRAYDKTVIGHSLLTELKSGNEEAFRQLFSRWEKPLYTYIYKITGSQSDAEDICQETFTNLWIHRNTIDPAKDIKNYIFLITKQIIWKYFRENKRKENFLTVYEVDDNDNVSPDNILQLREMELLAELIINKLPPRTREMYNLYYKDNLSYEHIAKILDTNPVNVKTQIYQARQKMKEITSKFFRC